MSSITQTEPDSYIDRFIDSIDPESMRDARHIREIAHARQALEASEKRLIEAVRAARAAGDSWTMIGIALHTSKQNAHRKFGKLIGEVSEEVNMGTNNERHVVPAKEGGWDVVKPGSDRVSSHHDTQADAIGRAREIIRNAGGGELNIHGRDGRIREKDTIPKGNDPRSSKG